MQAPDPRAGAEPASGTRQRVAAPPAEQTAAAAVDLRDPALYVNRELSLLEFQTRVLEEAWDETNPLLERVKFLAILGSNLGEFFMVRIAGLKQQVAAGIVEASADGMTPAAQLVAARARAHELMREARRCWAHMLPQLEAAGVHVLDYAGLDEQQQAVATKYFDEKVFPVLTPLAFDPGRPFPHISNLSLNLAVLVRDPRAPAGERSFARVKAPTTLPRLVPVGPPAGVADEDERARHAWLLWQEQLIAAHLDRLFTGLEIIGSWPFRVTRDAEMTIQEMEADDLLETVEEGVRRRRFGSVVRVSVETHTPQYVRDILVENMQLDAADMIALDAPLGTSGLNLGAVDRPDLNDPLFVPAMPPEFEEEPVTDVFALIRQHDMLLHRPYDSFAPVLAFLRQAACDPDVLAIKQTLYRVGRDAPVVKALLEAAGNGKEVAVLVELKARFDEESNIEWARALEREGVHVVYGLLGLKTHSKIALVVRREGDGIRRYLHLGTGNYNAVTARLYTDLDYLTCDEQMGADASDAFNGLTGYASVTEYRKFLVAPVNLRQGMEALIRREIDHARRGEPAHLILKMNSLVDRRMCKLLYQASQAGVKAELLVRGICCLRPGVPGVSENITVTSIVGRFLEHSRIFWFRNGGAEEVYLGSADLMPRNLDRRVEILFPVEDKKLVRRLRDEVLATCLADTVKARRMNPDGTYERVLPEPGEEPLNSQESFLARRPGYKGASRRR